MTSPRGQGSRLRAAALAAALLAPACDRSSEGSAPTALAPGGPARAAPRQAPTPGTGAPTDRAAAEPSRRARGLGPGFPLAGPWVSFYGTAAQMRDLAKVAATYRIINIDADPGAGNFSVAQIATLKAGGRNRVLSYLNVGACETYRDYWSRAPAGFVPCGSNRGAHLGAYEGYPDETWMNPADPAHQKLVVEHVAARLAARGIDGLYLDNLELLGHGTKTKNGPCDQACRQGGLDLVRKLRERFPDLLLVMQNGTSDVTRLGVTGGLAFPRLLDGVAHEEVYAPRHDDQAERELLAWKAMGLASRDGHPFWIAVEDYVGSCANTTAARAAVARAQAHGFSSYVSDESSGQHVVCYW